MMSKEKTYDNENDVKAEIKKILTRHKWHHWMPGASAFGLRTVDHMALRDGIFMAIEAKHTKTSRGANANQKRFLKDAADNGGFAFLVNEHNIDQFDKWMDAFERGARAVAANGKPPMEDTEIMFNAMKALTEGYLVA